jgi:hypothetical protein
MATNVRSEAENAAVDPPCPDEAVEVLHDPSPIARSAGTSTMTLRPFSKCTTQP